MTVAPGAQFEIKVDGIVRTHRDVRETAIEAARNLQQRNPSAKITVTVVRHTTARIQRSTGAGRHLI